MPDFPHRVALRELAQMVEEQSIMLKNAIHPLTVHLQGGDAVIGLSPEWTDLTPIPARLRILSQMPGLGAGAWAGEVEYEDGAAIDDVTVAEAVRGMVVAGTFHLRRTAIEATYRRIDAGGTFFLNHDEQHGWRVEGPTRSVLVFTPPHPAPAPEPAGCSITPNLFS